MASIHVRGDSFCIRWRAAGSRQRCCTFRGPSNVKAVAAKQYIEAHGTLVTSAQVYAAIDPYSSPTIPHTPTPLLCDWIERWLTLKVDVAGSTHGEYTRLLRGRISRDLGHLRVGDISRHEHLDPWKAALSRQLMPAGVRKYWTVLSQVMRDTVPHFRLDNPLELPHGRRHNGLPRITAHRACVLEFEQAGILLAHCPAPIHDLVLAALGTGMRLGELLALRVADLRPGEAPVVRVEQSLRRDGSFAAPKTVRSRRSVALSAGTAALFGVLVSGKQPEELVFNAPGGSAWDAGNLRQRYWQPAVIAAQRCREHPPVPAGNGWVSAKAVSTCLCPGRLRSHPRLQDLRHCHVAYLIAAGWDFYAIQLRLGHASIRTTFDVYGHLMPSGDVVRLAELDRQLPAVQPDRACGARPGSATRRSLRPSVRRIGRARRLGAGSGSRRGRGSRAAAKDAA